MNYFEFRGDDGYVKITLQEVFGFPNQPRGLGGFETQSEIEIKCQGYLVKGPLWITTTEIHAFYCALEHCYRDLKGSFGLKTFEGQLELRITLKEGGHCEIVGEYIENPHLWTKLIFEIRGEQTYLSRSIEELNLVVEKYRTPVPALPVAVL